MSNDNKEKLTNLLRKTVGLAPVGSKCCGATAVEEETKPGGEEKPEGNPSTVSRD